MDQLWVTGHPNWRMLMDVHSCMLVRSDERQLCSARRPAECFAAYLDRLAQAAGALGRAGRQRQNRRAAGKSSVLEMIEASLDDQKKAVPEIQQLALSRVRGCKNCPARRHRHCSDRKTSDA